MQESGNGDVILSCPPREAGGLALEIRNRGNCPLQIGDGVIAELTVADIRESWATARKLPRHHVAAMTRSLGQDLMDRLSEDYAESQPEHMVGDAAAFLFLALRHRDKSLELALSGCRIVWHEREQLEDVEYLA